MNIDLIYQYLEEYSDKSIKKFCELFYNSPKEVGFIPEDIPQLCDVLFRIECNLEDENSYNIDWPLKDNILDTILCLAVESGDSHWIDVIVRFMNSFNSISRPYLQHRFWILTLCQMGRLQKFFPILLVASSLK